MPELRLPFFAHGGDYNPDQWRHIPGTLEEDVRLMKLAHCNLMSVGIFSGPRSNPGKGNTISIGWSACWIRSTPMAFMFSRHA